MLDKKMDERNTNYALAKPDYRLWFSYFCLPFFLGSLGSMVLWIAQKRTCTKDLSALLNYLNNSVQNWQAPLVVSLLMPLLLLPLFQHLLNKKSAQSSQKNQQTKQEAMSGPKAIPNLIRHSYPALPRIWIYLSSKRFDLWICSALGAWAGYLLANTFIYDAIFAIEPALDATSSYWLLLYGMLLLPALVLLRLWDCAIAKMIQCYRLGLFSFAQYIFTAFKVKVASDKNGRVLHDIPIMHSDADLFDWGDKAKAFSREVLAAPNGMAFGVEAPWGTGKTSFINLCEKQWDTQAEDKVVIYRFELLTYAGNPNLIEQFVLGLLDELQKHYYLPELRGALQGYLGGLQGALELSGGPLKLTFNNPPSSIEEALSQVRAQLERRLPPKMCLVVIIDDLDRAPPDGVRDLLFALHKCFALPRLRYVLCYDQQQLAHKAELHHQHGGDLASQTLYEFLDKFVTTRVYLHTTYQGLKDYVEKQLLPQLELRSDLPSQWRSFIIDVLQEGALMLLRQVSEKDQRSAKSKEINDDQLLVEQNHVYWSLLGDVRKLKSLFNQICLCWQKGVELQQHDFYAGDLVRLLLLQQAYPEVFRSIRAQAHSGEYLHFRVNTSGNENSPGQGLEFFIAKEKSRYPENSWQQQHALETLLRGLFDPKVPSSSEKSVTRAARGYRLPEYFNLLLQEQTPALHSSQTYRTWFWRQWCLEKRPLEELLRIEVWVEHENAAENWQDQHEYALWELLLGQFSQYEQRKELLTEFLQALPRFTAYEKSNCGRNAMVNLLVKSLHRLHTPDNGIQKSKDYETVWKESMTAILAKCSDNNLLCWKDAILVYESISYSEQVQQEFWTTLLSVKTDKKNLTPTHKDLLGNRTGAAKDWQPDPSEWLASLWKELWYLSRKQPDSTQERVENWLFKECWGEPQPSGEQAAWWLDFLLHFLKRETPDSGEFQLKLPDDLSLRMQHYAKHSIKLIESVRLQQTQTIDHGDKRTQIKYDLLLAALTDLCEKPWDKCVTEDDSAKLSSPSKRNKRNKR